jgi:hypothetical protein
LPFSCIPCSHLYYCWPLPLPLLQCAESPLPRAPHISWSHITTTTTTITTTTTTTTTTIITSTTYRSACTSVMAAPMEGSYELSFASRPATFPGFDDLVAAGTAAHGEMEGDAGSGEIEGAWEGATAAAAGDVTLDDQGEDQEDDVAITRNLLGALRGFVDLDVSQVTAPVVAPGNDQGGMRAGGDKVVSVLLEHQQHQRAFDAVMRQEASKHMDKLEVARAARRRLVAERKRDQEVRRVVIDGTPSVDKTSPPTTTTTTEEGTRTISSVDSMADIDSVLASLFGSGATDLASSSPSPTTTTTIATTTSSSASASASASASTGCDDVLAAFLGGSNAPSSAAASSSHTSTTTTTSSSPSSSSTSLSSALSFSFPSSSSSSSSSSSADDAVWGMTAEERRGLYSVSDSIAFAEFPDGQNGYFALRAIAAGELILSERPLRFDTRRDLPALARLILNTPALGSLPARPHMPLRRSPDPTLEDTAWTKAHSQACTNTWRIRSAVGESPPLPLKEPRLSPQLLALLRTSLQALTANVWTDRTTFEPTSVTFDWASGRVSWSSSLDASVSGGVSLNAVLVVERGKVEGVLREVSELLAPAACCLSLVAEEGSEGKEGSEPSLHLQFRSEAQRDLWASAVGQLWEHRRATAAWKDQQGRQARGYFLQQVTFLSRIFPPSPSLPSPSGPMASHPLPPILLLSSSPPRSRSSSPLATPTRQRCVVRSWRRNSWRCTCMRRCPLRPGTPWRSPERLCKL